MTFEGQLTNPRKTTKILKPQGIVRQVFHKNYIMEGYFDKCDRFSWGRKIVNDKFHIGKFCDMNTPDGFGIGNLYTGGDEVKEGVYDVRQQGDIKGNHFREDGKIIQKQKFKLTDIFLDEEQEF